MKERFDVKSVKRDFSPGDQALILLPMPGSILHAKFAGPYLIERRLNETNYVVATPDRKCKNHVCHVNRLKAYVSRTSSDNNSKQVDSLLTCAAATVRWRLSYFTHPPSEFCYITRSLLFSFTSDCRTVS